MKKYLFIDRDGTLVREPEDFQVDSLEKISFAPKVIPALNRLKDAGFTFVMVSNQDGLGTSSFPLEDFTKPHEFILNTLKSQGITFEQVLICPHFEKDNCDCRKPKLGMVMAYLKDTSWDRAHSFFIGDRQTDLQMGENMGINSILYHEDSMPWDKIADNLTVRHRIATVSRHTKETKIDITVDLDHHGCSKIDTGMGRIGFPVTEESADTIRRICSLPNVCPEGMFTHFAKADETDKTYTYGQHKKFMFELFTDGTVDEIVSKVKKAGIPFGIGGVGRVNCPNLLPAENVLCEHYRLGSSMVILSRTFCDWTQHSTADFEKIITKGIAENREYEQQIAKQSSAFFAVMHRETAQKIAGIIS